MKRTLSLLITAAAFALAAAPAQAKHSWGNWHWERSANPVTLPVLNSTTDVRTPVGGQNWPALLARSASDWSSSAVLDLAVRPQSAADLAAQQACPFMPDTIRVCNVFNPNVTWLGLATVLPDVSSGQGHLLAATAQVNDAWFSTPLYSELNAQHVMCQEIGHTFGLDHQDESGADLNTCMDYADALDNPSPNAHDYQQLSTIYQHLDGAGSGGGNPKGGKGDKGGGKGDKGPDRATAGWSPTAIGYPPTYHGSGAHGAPHADSYVTREDGRTIVRYVLWAY